MTSKRDFFVITNSFAAPFFSDGGSGYISAESLNEAKSKVVSEYDHPAGLYAAAIYESADAYHKDQEPLATYLSNYEFAKQKATAGLSGYSFTGRGMHGFEVNGQAYMVENWKGGSWT